MINNLQRDRILQSVYQRFFATLYLWNIACCIRISLHHCNTCEDCDTYHFSGQKIASFYNDFRTTINASILYAYNND